MISGSTNEEERALREMSALADGECEPGQLLAACEAWRREPQARVAWHTYSLIGDVMRSEDLASSAAHDEAFLQRLRGRLAEEPVVLAPMAVPQVREESAAQAQSVRLVAGGAAGARRSLVRRRWVSPAAVAAGLMMATGAMVVMRDSAGPEGGQQQVAAVPVQPRTLPQPVVSSPGEDELIRNAQLDRYLNAHRQFSQGAALAMPGAVRQVAVNPSNR